MDAPPWPFFRYWKSVPVSLWLICLSFLCCCRTRHHGTRQTDHSFYYWKSVYALTGRERQVLQTLQVHTLYIRFFDVSWDLATRQARPVAVVRFSDLSFHDFSVVPVVFITNETLLNIDLGAVPSLAEKIAGLITQLRQQNQLLPASKIQLDCDWTASTERYFKKAMEASTDKNFKARCLFMMAKCSQKNKDFVRKH